jgi:small subunit ribosomal protein S12e
VAIVHDGVLKGLRECVKALDKRTALLCLLAENCDEPSYVRLVEALCAEHTIPLIRVKERKALGEWLGMCKFDKEGKARKVVGSSVCVIRDYGKETAALDVVREYIKSQS